MLKRTTARSGTADISPIDLGAELLGAHLPAALALDVDGNVRSAGLRAICDVVQMTLGGLTSLGERIALGTRKGQPECFEEHDGAGYHHRVIRKSIPFADFHLTVMPGETSAVVSVADIQKRRREATRAYVDAHFGGSLNAFAEKIGHSQPHLHAAVNGKKPFGEKLAGRIQEKLAALGLPPIDLFVAGQSGGRIRLANSLEHELLDAFRALRPERQLEIVKDLAMEALRQATGSPPSKTDNDPLDAGRRFG